ncbi:rNA polymerase sigma factor [Clostridium sp. CAG:354]|nr:sigma-70 family RNA polymerase sigma factor [Clostridium sp.]MBS5863512.1 sigma-70 family RNA polymerase sigma factor [Clostridium sp.]MEE0269355.1 sigma-70 family RNA polymerase sigma factor [Clostridia bacterium]CDE11042.1 rNA polymerase sigma factor [Clostridium sp. CAG:354]
MQDVKEILIEYIKDNQEKLYRIAFSYSKNEEAALDIVQEAITKALKNINKLSEESYIKTWFYRILINESLQYIRKNKRILTYELEAIENKVDCNVDFAEGLDVYKYVQDLNEKLKTVIILRFFEDMKISEIAKITKTNESTVKSRLYKGLKELKRLIEE